MGAEGEKQDVTSKRMKRLMRKQRRLIKTGKRTGVKSDPHSRAFVQKMEGKPKVDHTEYEGPSLAETKDWIQGAVNPKHKGYCTPMTKKTCTPARKALAKRFKKAGRREGTKKGGKTGWKGKV